MSYEGYSALRVAVERARREGYDEGLADGIRRAVEWASHNPANESG